MKKRTIGTILALMTIALLGVIAVQVYWLARSSALEERLFKERVNRAMERVVRQLEAREMKAQVMKSLSDVRRTVNDAKVQQFKLQQANETRREQKLRQSEQKKQPIIAANQSNEKSGSKPQENSSSAKSLSSPSVSAPIADQQSGGVGNADINGNMNVVGESGSFEMRFGNDGTFSFRSSKTQHSPRSFERSPQPPPTIVMTLPENRMEQPFRLVLPNVARNGFRTDSLAERIRNRFRTYRRHGGEGHNTASRKNNAALANETSTEAASTGIETSEAARTTPERQPFIGGRKTLEDRMMSADQRRRVEAYYEQQKAQREALQHNLSRSMRDLERLRKLNVMNASDMRQLDSSFNAAVSQAIQDFGSFGFEFRMSTAIPTPPPPPEQPSSASQDSVVHSATKKTTSRTRAIATAPNANSSKETKPYTGSHATTNPTVNKTNTPHASMIARDTIEKIIDRVDFVESIMETMFSGKRTVTDRFAMNDIDSLLRNELQNNDITAPFEYGIMRGANVVGASGVSRHGDSMMIVKTSSHTHEAQSSEYRTNTSFQATAAKQLATSKYRARLFPNDLFANEEHYLVVRFPNYSPGLSLAGIGAEVSLAAVFLLMIIGCFGFTFVALMQQKKLSDMKTDFINNMTHELKTPIATISIASEALKDDHVRSETVRVERFVNIIHDENKRLAGHVEKVLQAAQMDRGDLKLNLQITDIHTLVETAAESLALQLEQKQGSIELHLDASNSTVSADEVHLTNVIFNLLDNANKYTPEKPHIVITTRNTSQGLALTIQDNGIGMTREAQKHIFEKFYRVPTGNRHDVKGFGLGLNYVQTIIEAHGGSISVKSELGKGSTFEVFMPNKG